ncbi:DUF6350 family protein [Ruania rhizosphaerae]|uniref:cell division protein PerM n=1 Tax=Ruania rhizosphaerae TaxID=1840413 RepID=UPI001357CB53|nr:DUF6350 family protein [Ruania rhizosphaerae]
MSPARTPAPAHDAPRIVPRVVEHTSTRRALRTPEGALRGLLAGAEAVLLSWLVVVVPAIATYVATASAPALGSAGWLEAARVGTAAWLLGHGASASLDGLDLSLVPLGVTVLAVALMAGSVRRARLPGWPAATISAAVYVAFAILFVIFVGLPGANRALVGAVLVAGVGTVLGLPTASLPSRLLAALARVPGWIRTSFGGSWRALALHLLIATAAVVTAVVVNFGQVRDLHEGLHPDIVSGIVLVLAQLLALPNLVVYAASFLLGPGFAVGEGTAFAPSGVEAGPLPIVPVLGALPGPDSLAGQLPVLGVVGLVSGVAVGVWLARRLRARTLVDAVATTLGTALLTGGGMATLAALASGAAGPGRMAVIGADPFSVGLALLWQVGAPALVLVLLSHRSTVASAGQLTARARRAGGTWWEQVRG